MRGLFFVCTFLLLFGCSTQPDEQYITSRLWVHSEGACAGDEQVMNFSKGMYEYRHDTIFYSGVPVAMVISLYKNDNLIKLKTIPDGKEGSYLDQVEFTR